MTTKQTNAAKAISTSAKKHGNGNGNGKAKSGKAQKFSIYEKAHLYQAAVAVLAVAKNGDRAIWEVIVTKMQARKWNDLPLTEQESKAIPEAPKAAAKKSSKAAA